MHHKILKDFLLENYSIENRVHEDLEGGDPADPLYDEFEKAKVKLYRIIEYE